MLYLIHLLILIIIYSLVAQSFNLTFGFGKLLNFAHITFIGVSAYTTAILATKLNLSFGFCLIISALVCVLFSMIVSIISTRLKQDYFALGTFTLNAFFLTVVINWKQLTNGVLGISSIPRPTILGLNFYNNFDFLILVCIIFLICQVLLYLIFKSSFSRSLKALAENENHAMSVAVNINKMKRINFIISALFASIAGCLLAYYFNYMDSTFFVFSEMVFILTAVILAGPFSFFGVFGAVALLIIIPEPLRLISLNPDIVGPLRQLLYGLILLGIIYFKRKSLLIQRKI
ncbi:MAG: branched-chain amino acid ABC transporter permease [Candidatus Falkowbacteria bacterium]